MRSLWLFPVAWLAACATNPVTGRSQLSLVSEGQEIEMGRGELARSKQETGFVENAALAGYVSEIGLRMARASERPNLPWEFHVLDDPMVNAFAAPGGFIFITRGILAHLNSEAELAGVIGHEIGHVTAKHSVAQISQSTLLGAVAVGATILNPTAGEVVGAGAGIFQLSYGRGQESQADGLGHRYSLRQQYDVRDMPKTFRTLERLGEGGASSRGPAFLSTHPDPGDRVAKTQAWADTISDYRTLHADRDRFLARIDGLVYGADPQQGYFEGARYLHPVLRLRFDAPSGWQGVNQRSQVIAAQPDGQAQIVLSTAQQSTPEAAMQAFLQQQGVQSGGAQRITVNGLAAMAADFTAATQQGQQLRGQVVTIAHGGTVYQFLGLALATAWGAHGNAIGTTLRSFAPTAANQQFQRRRHLQVVTLPRATTVGALAGQSGGAATPRELALINGVEEGATLAGGTKVKTIVYR